MLRIIANKAASSAKTYFGTGSDYYSEGQELIGTWLGRGAEALGLRGNVTAKDWNALCDNLDPRTGNKLTLRQKEPRRVGYDFNWHPPKSVSVLYGLTRDERLLTAFRESVNETMADIEDEMKARVRRGGRNEDRITGNIVAGEYIHFTARPVGGVPDPHLHIHAFVFNATFDDQEKKWKAGQFGDLKRDAPFFEAEFHSRLSARLADLGLPIVQTKQGWEIGGMTPAMLSKFSRRSAQIDKEAERLGIHTAKGRDGLGARTREQKAKELSLDELRDVWKSRLTEDEQAAIRALTISLGRQPALPRSRNADQALSRAVHHCFERKAVVADRELLTAALRRSYGHARPEDVFRSYHATPFLTAQIDGRRWVTTASVAAEEQRMIDFARSGRGTRAALGDPNRPLTRQWLNAGQRNAVQHVLGSHDSVIMIRGAAGTGKTSSMSEAVEGIEAGGRRVFTFAPSADASRGVLRQEGFATADTVARLLVDQKLQEQVRGNVIWVDEAGLVGTPTMAKVFALAGELDARVILSGDARQHKSIERGSVLRLLESEAGIIPTEITDIMRQKGAYKQAAKALSEGRTAEGFRQLDKLGWIKELRDDTRYATLAADYVEAIQKKKTVLAISPTHREGAEAAAAIRAALKQAKILGDKERKFTVLDKIGLTEEQRGDAVNFTPGEVLVFQRSSDGHKKGDRVVVGRDALPLRDASSFQAFHARELSLAQGDVIRITQNGQSADAQPHRLNNGSAYVVKGFTRQGDIRLTNGWTISKDFSFITQGYVVTNFSSQGKTVDRTLVAAADISLPAVSQAQLYVASTRSRERVTFYTHDKRELLRSATRDDAQLAASDLLAIRARREQRIRLVTASRQYRDPSPREHYQQKEGDRGR